MSNPLWHYSRPTMCRSTPMARAHRLPAVNQAPCSRSFHHNAYATVRGSRLHCLRKNQHADAQPRVRADAYQHGWYASNVCGVRPSSRAPLNASLGVMRNVTRSPFACGSDFHALCDRRLTHEACVVAAQSRVPASVQFEWSRKSVARGQSAARGARLINLCGNVSVCTVVVHRVRNGAALMTPNE